jgi:hypothetical protein
VPASDLGEAVTLTTLVTDASGDATDTTMALTVTAPDGTTTTPTVTNPTTGTYTALVTPDQTGTWFYAWDGTGDVVVKDSGQFTVADPAPPAYASLAAFKRRLGEFDATDDELLDALLVSARRLEEDCGGRRFYRDRTATSRIYTVTHPRILVVDDFASADITVEVGCDPTFTEVTGYRIKPDNCFARGKPGNVIEHRWFGPQVRVTAPWGYPAIPPAATEANLMLAQRTFGRKQAPFGLLNGFTTDVPVRVSRSDPDYEALIAALQDVEL